MSRGRGRDPGVVYLVGAGPGDPGLMTARSLELIASADVILHDRLIPAGALDGARDDAELVYVGKEPGRPRDGAGRDRGADGRAARERGAASSGSRAATRSSSAAAARRPRRWPRPGSRSRSCPGSPPGSPRPPTPGSRSPTATTPRRSPSSPATRTPTRRSRRSTGRRSPRFPGTLVLYMGVEEPAADRRAPDRRRARSRRARRGDRARHPARPANGRRDPRRACRGAVAEAGLRAAGDPALRPGRRPARDGSPGSSAGRCTAGASSSPAPAPRRAGSPRRCAALGAEVVELPAIRIEPRIDTAEVARRGRRPAHLRARLPDQPERRPPAVRGDGRRRAATPARSPTRRSPRSARAPRAALRRARRDRRRRPRALRRRGAGRGARARSTSAAGRC